LTLADISLFYVSRWKTAQAAKRFAYLYKSALAKRDPDAREQTIDNTNCVQTAPCSGPLWLSRLATREGPAYLEVLPNHTVIIVQGFNDAVVAQLRRLTLNLENPHPDHKQADGFGGPRGHELSLSLYESPAFRAFQDSVFPEILSQIYADSR
jgi:hypothetical protein